MRVDEEGRLIVAVLDATDDGKRCVRSPYCQAVMPVAEPTCPNCGAANLNRPAVEGASRV